VARGKNDEENVLCHSLKKPFVSLETVIVEVENVLAFVDDDEEEEGRRKGMFFSFWRKGRQWKRARTSWKSWWERVPWECSRPLQTPTPKTMKMKKKMMMKAFLKRKVF
jgi:hypothetical protein